MKLFISADIEGCAGVALTDETHKKESVYQRFAEAVSYTHLTLPTNSRV